MKYIATKARAGLMGPAHVEAAEAVPGLIATVAQQTSAITAAQGKADAALPRSGGVLTGPVMGSDVVVTDAATVAIDIRAGQIFDWTVTGNRTLGPLLAAGLDALGGGAAAGGAGVWEGTIFFHATTPATVAIDASYKLPSGAAYSIVMAAGDIWRMHILYRRRRGRASASVAKETP